MPRPRSRVRRQQETIGLPLISKLSSIEQTRLGTCTTFGPSPAAALRQASVAERPIVLPPVREHIMTPRKISLKVVTAPAVGVVLEAPPALQASEHSVDYTCGRCATVLLHADEGQVRGILIHCTKCGSYNSTDA